MGQSSKHSKKKIHFFGIKKIIFIKLIEGDHDLIILDETI